MFDWSTHLTVARVLAGISISCDGTPWGSLLVYKYSEYQNKGGDIVKNHVATQTSTQICPHTEREREQGREGLNIIKGDINHIST